MNLNNVSLLSVVVFFSLSGISDCVLALGFEKMERGSLGSKVDKTFGCS